MSTALPYAFDATQVAPQAPREVLPPGDYLCVIVNSEMRPTKSGDGQYLALEHDIIDGPHKNRKLWNNLNLINPNQQAVDIAKAQLSALCHAIGVMHVTDSTQLHGRPVLVNVRTKPVEKDGQGNVVRDASNEVKGYKLATGTAPAPHLQQQPVPQPQAWQPTTTGPTPAASYTQAPTPAPAPLPPPPQSAPVGPPAGGPPWRR